MLFLQCQPGLQVMAERYLGIYSRISPVPVGSYPAVERLYLWACMAWGWAWAPLSGLDSQSKQSFQGLIDHLSLGFQSCETVSSLIGDFYNWSQKFRKTEDTFADELQVLVRKIVAQKPEFLGETNQALKHQFANNLGDPYFWVVARRQCLASPDFKSFTQFWGHLATMFCSHGKHAKAVHTTSVAVNSEEIGGDSLQEQHLSHNSCKHHNKIDTQVTETTMVRLDSNKALQENQ